jgi:hypothetical protein
LIFSHSDATGLSDLKFLQTLRLSNGKIATFVLRGGHFWRLLTVRADHPATKHFSGWPVRGNFRQGRQLNKPFLLRMQRALTFGKTNFFIRKWKPHELIAEID